MKKRILFGMVLFFATVGVAMQTGKQVTLTWDPMPATEKWQAVRIYDNATQVAEALCANGTCPTEIGFMMSRAAHSFTARSWDGNWESDDSNVVVVNGPPKPPTNLKK